MRVLSWLIEASDLKQSPLAKKRATEKKHFDTPISDTSIHDKSIPDKSINETLKFDTLKATSYMLAEQRFTEKKVIDDCEDCHNDGRVEVAEQSAGFLRRRKRLEELEVLVHGVCWRR